MKTPSTCSEQVQEHYKRRRNSTGDLEGVESCGTCFSMVAGMMQSKHRWIGSVVRTEDQKKFYSACWIDGLAYKLQDHALVRLSNGNRLIPSKILDMWEDNTSKVQDQDIGDIGEVNTNTKWLKVNRFYFPNDLPVAVESAYQPEASEVYASTVNCDVMVGYVNGHCEVLSPPDFSKASERRGDEPNQALGKLYMCKMVYDESGLLHDRHTAAPASAASPASQD